MTHRAGQRERRISRYRAAIESNGLFVFFRGNDRDVLPYTKAMDEGLVSVDIRFLLLFALDVGRACRPRDVQQSGASDSSGSHPGRKGNP